MKKILCILLAVIVLFLFCACGTDESAKAPGENLIRADIQKSLSEYQSKQDACALTIQDYQTVQSLTENDSYTAQITVTAESKYAQFHYTANIAYFRYDQGWIMDSCQWNSTGYEIVRYPNGDDLEDVEDRYIVQDMKAPVFTGENNTLTVTNRTVVDWSAYVTGSTESVATWEYDPHSDSWDYQDTVNHTSEYLLTDAFADTIAEIFECSNFSENGFDITTDNEYFRVDPTHVELSEYSSRFEEDLVLLVFASEYDIAFRNNVLKNEGQGYMDVFVVIYKEPQTSTGHSYDMVVSITMVDEYWSTKPRYDIAGYHYL